MAKTNVVALPVPRHTFKAVVVDVTKVIAKYDSLRVYLAVCLSMLQMSPQEMKKKVAAFESEDGASDHIIDAFRDCAEDFATLAHFFESAAARMTIVHRRLI